MNPQSSPPPLPFAIRFEVDIVYLKSINLHNDPLLIKDHLKFDEKDEIAANLLFIAVHAYSISRLRLKCNVLLPKKARNFPASQESII